MFKLIFTKAFFDFFLEDNDPMLLKLILLLFTVSLVACLNEGHTIPFMFVFCSPFLIIFTVMIFVSYRSYPPTTREKMSEQLKNTLDGEEIL